MGIFNKKFLIETRKNSLVVMAEEKFKSNSKKNKKIWKDGVNQRANEKLLMVSETIKAVVEDNVEIKNNENSFETIMTFSEEKHINEMKMYYYSRNTLFARVFDLIFKSEIKAFKETGVEENLDIGIKFKGGVKFKDVEFVNFNNKQEEMELTDYLNGIDIIKRKILKLEIFDFRIKYNCTHRSWTILLGMGKGSTVWSLFPPVLMMVDFTKLDAIRTIELFRLVLVALKAFEKNKTLFSAA